jgi:tripartite-type tricarboxylate transporter receptor subunit TctC
MLVATTSVQAQTVKELVALAKAQPGKLNMGSSGTGSSPHLVGELFRLETGVDVVHVPYKGDVALQPALIGGEVQFAFVSPIAALQHLKTGRLRGLAVTGLQRAAVAPDVPTMVEAGVPDFEFVGWVGFFAPAKTPREVLARVAAETARTLAMPDIAERVPGWGGVATGSSPEEFTRRYRTDLAKFARIVKEARVPLID